MTDITDDMIEAAARALAVTPWDIAPVIRQQAERVLTVALAGLTIVDKLPVPAYDTETDVLTWGTDDGNTPLMAYLNLTGNPQIETADGEYWTPDELERDALTRLSAAREARALPDRKTYDIPVVWRDSDPTGEEEPPTPFEAN